jgi:hypothetical protein
MGTGTIGGGNSSNQIRKLDIKGLAGKKDECIQFQLGSEFIDCFTIGFESYDEFKDILKRIPEASVRA